MLGASGLWQGGERGFFQSAGPLGSPPDHPGLLGLVTPTLPSTRSFHSYAGSWLRELWGWRKAGPGLGKAGKHLEAQASTGLGISLHTDLVHGEGEGAGTIL